MKISIILVIGSMMVSFDLSHACSLSKSRDCRRTMQAASSNPHITPKEACRVIENYLECIKTCDNRELKKEILYTIFSDHGIECNGEESQTTSPDPDAVVSSTPQAIQHISGYLPCRPTLIEQCSLTVTLSTLKIKTTLQACRLMDTFLHCMRSCGDPDDLKELAYKKLSNYGIKCGESQTSRRDDGTEDSSRPKVLATEQYNDDSLYCHQSVVENCKNNLIATSKITRRQACSRLRNSFLDCTRSCGNRDKMNIIANGIIFDNGIVCGSAMVTLSGTMVMLMLFITLRNFF